jgi:hypothetical protein
MPRSDNHWKFENYVQRMTTKEWKAILLGEQDVIIFNGRVRRLKARRLGAGIVEVYKERKDADAE